MPSVLIKTYGCASSQNDSEIIAGALKNHGFEIIDEDALIAPDLVIIVSCSVKNVTENKILHYTGELLKQNKKVLVVGCLADTNPSAFNRRVSLLGTKRINKITETCNEILKGKVIRKLGGEAVIKNQLIKMNRNPVIEIIEIQSGCLHNCSFCSTKIAKGSLVSYPEDLIIKQMNCALKKGVKEFWITGQDISSYGEGKKLPQLLKNILNEVKGEYKIRLGMMNPDHMKNFYSEMHDIYIDSRVFKFLHLPIQSGSPEILKKMKRGQDIDSFLEIVKSFSGFTIWTDIIAGFPSETEEDFKQTIELLKKIKPDFVNVSAFASRHGTEARKMKPLPSELVKERTKNLSVLVETIAAEKNKKWIGQTCHALMDEFKPEKNCFIARNEFYKPIVLKKTDIPLHQMLGQKYRVEITNASATALFGSFK